MFKILGKLLIIAIFILSFTVDSGGTLKGEGLHSFYLYSNSSSAKIKTLKESNAKNFFYFKNNLKGESVEFFSQEKVDDLLKNLNAVFVFSEEGELFNCAYYYSDEIDEHVTLNGYKINVHVAKTKTSIIVGTPMIFGSF